jgi:hypothetical protein
MKIYSFTLINKDLVIRDFFHEGYEKQPIFLRINIYRDRFIRLLGLSQSTYIDNMLK